MLFDVWTSLFGIMNWYDPIVDLKVNVDHLFTIVQWFYVIYWRQHDVLHRGYSNVWSEYDFYFIEWSEKMYISWVPKARMKYTFFHFTRWNKSHIHSKHLNFLFIIYITFDRKDANLAFARESLTRSFVPWRHDVHVLFCLVTLDMTSETRIGV